MKLRALLLCGLAAVVYAGCAGGGGSTSGPSPLVQTFIASANFPSSLRFAPDGRLFFTELDTGIVRVHENGVTTTFTTIPVATSGENGLLSMAFDPDFANNRFVYFFHTAPSPDRGRIVRYTDTAGVGTNETVIVDNLPSTSVHNGGRIAFGPDGKLYVSIGDNTNPANSQNTGVVSGKILRYNADGTIPGDNPIGGNPMFALGLRNTFGIAFHPTLGVLYGSENGPTCDDEINRLVANGNYGWRTGQPCGDTDPGFLQPILKINPVRAPTGIAFYTGSAFPEWQNSLLVASLNDDALRRYTLNSTGTQVLSEQVLYLNGGTGGLLDVTVGPDGNIYMAGANAIMRIVRQ
jgi:aldose sugar dehydrogenase